MKKNDIIKKSKGESFPPWHNITLSKKACRQLQRELKKTAKGKDTPVSRYIADYLEEKRELEEKKEAERKKDIQDFLNILEAKSEKYISGFFVN